MALNSITAEIEKIIEHHLEYYKVNSNWKQDPYKIEVSLKGPENSPYEGGMFVLKLEFSNNFPFKLPTVKFLTKIFHPEIDSNGRVCSECFLYDWSTKDIILGLLKKISQILKNPSSNCYIFAEATDLFISDRFQFNSTAADWTRKYANTS